MDLLTWPIFSLFLGGEGRSFSFVGFFVKEGHALQETAQGRNASRVKTSVTAPPPEGRAR